MPILISIRKKYVDRIFDGFKRLEFRKFFPENYRGTLVIYECGPESCHKIVGRFRTEKATKFDPSLGITKEVQECVKCTDYTMADVEALNLIKEPTFIVPVQNPVRMAPVTLEEFSAQYKIVPVLTAPRSWTRFKCEASRSDKQ